MSAKPPTAIPIPATIIPSAKNNVVNSKIDNADPVTFPANPGVPLVETEAIVSATVGINETPTITVIKPCIILPRLIICYVKV